MKNVNYFPEMFDRDFCQGLKYTFDLFTYKKNVPSKLLFIVQSQWF